MYHSLAILLGAYLLLRVFRIHPLYTFPTHTVLFYRNTRYRDSKRPPTHPTLSIVFSFWGEDSFSLANFIFIFVALHFIQYHHSYFIVFPSHPRRKTRGWHSALLQHSNRQVCQICSASPLPWQY